MPDAIGMAGIAIGSFGLFLQLFDKCTAVQSTWQDGEDIGSDAMVFRIRLDMQVARLREWGVNWGIHNTDQKKSKKGYMLESHFKQHGDLAVQYVAVISQLLDNLRAETTANASISPDIAHGPLSAADNIARLHELEISDSPGRSLMKEQIRRIQRDASVIDRLRWGAEDEKATKTLNLIKDMVNELYLFFKPPQADTAAHLVFNSSLASWDHDVLNKIGITFDDDPLLQGLAYIKTATGSLQSRKTALDYVDVTKKLRQLKETVKPDARNCRGRGIMDDTDVLVEWKIEPSLSSTVRRNPQLESILIERRVQNIAKLLKFDLKPPELRTLDCLGVVAKSDPQIAGSGRQYGLIFRTPSPYHRTLLSILNKDPEIDLDLGERFLLAFQIVESLLLLHLAGWLHKGIRSDNILFFGSGPTQVSVDKPHIVGFEFSREATANNETEGVSDDLEFNLYRHPAVQGVPVESRPEDLEDDDNHDCKVIEPLATTPAAGTRTAARTVIVTTAKPKLPPQKSKRPPFAQTHDIYSLGVVLLEIGLLTSAITIFNTARRSPAYNGHTAQNFYSWLIENEVPKLSRTMGKIYRDAVESCLTGKLAVAADDKGLAPASATETGLYMNVLRSLASCHV